MDGTEAVEDGSLPDFTSALVEGDMPWVLRGRYERQLDWTIDYLRAEVLATEDVVAFLHPKGGNWFSELRARLDREQIPWVSLTREARWPEGDERIALSTMHSAKGLEFDHVVILGYNAEVVRHGQDANDALLDSQRRLLAMALGRARKSAIIGYKPSDASRLVGFLDPGTFSLVDL